MPATYLRAPVAESSFDQLLDAQTDVTGAEVVHIQIDRPRGIVHLNVNGVCLTRVCQIKNPIQLEELK